MADRLLEVQLGLLGVGSCGCVSCCAVLRAAESLCQDIEVGAECQALIT